MILHLFVFVFILINFQKYCRLRSVLPLLKSSAMILNWSVLPVPTVRNLLTLYTVVRASQNGVVSFREHALWEAVDDVALLILCPTYHL